MKKYPVDNFYVGNLNVAFPCNNLLLRAVGGYKLTNEEHRRYDLLHETIVRGAIDLEQLHMNNIISWSNGYRYNSLLSLFYKVEDDKYICLHNGNFYTTNNNDTFCNGLYKLSDVVPKFGYKLPNEISQYDSLRLFNSLFDKKKRFPYDREKFNINDFYLGELDLCCGYNDTNAVIPHVEMNIPLQIIMFGQGIYKTSGYGRETTVDNNIFIADYCVFNSIYLKLDDDNYYNINNFKIYNIDSFEPFSDKVSINGLLKNGEDYYNLPDKVSIPKLLKKQKK